MPLSPGEPLVKFNVASDDPWVAKEGAWMVHGLTGRRGMIVGWSDPRVWDDETEAWVDGSEEVQDLAYASITLEDEDGEAWTCTDPDNLHAPSWMPTPPLAVLSFDDMLAMPEPEWLIEGVLGAQQSALLFGRSNTHKTFLAIDMACSVGTGTSWHGCPVRQGPVLYVATEGARGVGRQRIPGWMEAHEIPAAERRNVSLYPQEIALDDPAAIQALLSTCAIARAQRDGDARWTDPAGAFALIVVDVFGASMAGSETSDETARAWVAHINRIMREVGCTVLVVAHSGWGDDARSRGHSHFWGSYDTRLKAEGDKAARTATLTVDRHKDHDSTGAWGFRLIEQALPTGQTTLVPVLADDVERGQRLRVSGKPAIALQALSEALTMKGRIAAGPGFPACPVVSLEDWRITCDRHGLTDSGNPETTRKAFIRARQVLADKGLVKQFDGFAWRADDPST